MRFITSIALVVSLVSEAAGVQVTFVNRTPMQVLVRCIAAGSVPIENEYSRKIDSEKRHSRSDFVPGLRVVAAWTVDGKRCAAMPTRITDGMEMVLVYNPELDEISFEAPCADCAAGASETYP